MNTPYTHFFWDYQKEICAIAKKARLSQKPLGIANKIIGLLNESNLNKQFKAEFKIEELKDPEEFISSLDKA
jgi:hypothetical protein